MQLHKVIGFVAGFGTASAAMPDLLAMLKRGDSQGMNPATAGIMGLFQVLWMEYGFLIASMPAMVWNIVAVVINGFMVSTCCDFARGEKMRLRQSKQLMCCAAGPMACIFEEHDLTCGA